MIIVMKNKIKPLQTTPKKAVISLKNDQETAYEFYIKIQDEITKAYHELRSVYVLKEFGKSSKNLIKDEFVEVRTAYPLLLSEAVFR